MTNGQGLARLPIVDSDGHLMEPFEMWQERRPEEYHERAWKCVTGAEGERLDVAAELAHLGQGGSVDADLADLADLADMLPAPAVAG